MLTRRAALFTAFGSPLLAHPSLPASRVDLFHAGDAGVHTYRIPALLETRKGTLLAVADARHDSARDMPAKISLVLRRSHNRGLTWSPTVTLRQVPEGGVGDASLLLDHRTGRIWCFQSYGPPGIGFGTAQSGARTGATTFQFHAIFSDNDGITWSEPRDLTPQIKDPAWQALFATSGTHIQTTSGRYLVPMVVRDGQGIVSSRNTYSDDGGKTWHIGAAIGPGTDESKCVELPGGVIMQNMRNGPTRAIALSQDGGINFRPVTHDAVLIDPVCNAAIVRYRHKRRDLLLFTNAASTKRENLTLRISKDQGKTWTVAQTLHAGPAAYSTVIALRDGSIAVLYECGETSPYSRITFTNLSANFQEIPEKSYPLG
jgi:sialidase-1